MQRLISGAVSQPTRHRGLTVEGCRILARQFREKVETHQARAATLIGQSRACPFDLHALLPVPSAILQLGPTHPTALAWLTAHWGVSDRLRQVVVREATTPGRRLKRHHAVIGYGFFTDGETPHAAIAHLATECRGGDRWWAERGAGPREPIGGAVADEPDGRGVTVSDAVRVHRPAGPSSGFGAGTKSHLGTIPLTALLDQLTASVRQAPAAVSLGQKADWW